MLGLKDVKRDRMKKLALVFMIALVFTSCEDQAPVSDSKGFKSVSTTGGTFTLRLTQFEGHTYVVMDGYNQGGICHAESCPCKSK